MMIFVISLLIIALAVLGMSIGVLNGRRPIRGSCGGLGGGLCACSESCKKENEFETRP